MLRRTLMTWSVATLSALGLTACSFTQSVTPSGNETPSGPLERGERYDVVFEVENYSYISWDPTNERLIAAHSDTTVSPTRDGLDVKARIDSLDVSADDPYIAWSHTHDLETYLVVYDIAYGAAFDSDPRTAIFGDYVFMSPSLREYSQFDDFDYLSASTGERIDQPACSHLLSRGVAACYPYKNSTAHHPDGTYQAWRYRSFYPEQFMTSETGYS